MEHSNKSTFIFHYREIPEWLEQSPIVFALVALFARRARREAGYVGWSGESIYLEPKQFLAGRKSLSYKLGITEGQYRSAYKKLIRYGLIQTIKTTKRYTIGLYCADKIFSINPSTNQPSEQPSELPSNDQELATNNNENNEKNDFKSRLKPSPSKSQESNPYKESVPLVGSSPEVLGNSEAYQKLREKMKGMGWKEKT